MADYDAIFIGSGINALGCAALLARAGWHVCVLERNEWLGGALRTAEISRPGFRHDLLSAWHPQWLASRAHRVLEPELRARGLAYRNTDLPAATAYPDGEAAFILRSSDATAAELDRHHLGDGEAWRSALERFEAQADLTLGLLQTELWSGGGAALALRAGRRLGREGLAALTGELMGSSRDWLEETFASPRTRGVIAPWGLHTGLGPEAANSAFRAQAVTFGKQTGGSPLPVGGSERLAAALVGYIRDMGGACETRRDVDRVVVRSGRAVGVELTGGEAVSARRAVLACATPTQLYGRLLRDAAVPAPVVEAARRFRYGRAGMQIHYALSEPARWEGDDRLARTALVHLTEGLDAVSRAVNEAECGLIPAEPTIVVGQPLTVDPSRAPAGRGLLWIQLLELPRRPVGDAAGRIAVAHEGRWDDELRERVADRIHERLSRHIPNLSSATLERVALGPHDLERLNINLVGGDPYAGALGLDQNLIWRPLPNHPGHRTPVKALWHVGASTWPGPGLGAQSGTIVADALLRPSVVRRGWSRVATAARARRADRAA